MFNKIGNKIKNVNFIFIIFIFLLSIIFLHNVISTSKIMNNIHHINDVTFISYNLKESLFKYGDLHLWTPYYYSGRPLYAQPEYYSFDIHFIYLLLFRNIFIAMNLVTITYFFLAGLGMYFLFLTFNDNKKGAFIASIIYMFNGYMHTFVIIGNLNVLASYSLTPFAFMFFVKALKSKNFSKNAIFSGLFIALQFFSGGTLLIPYEVVLFGLYALFFLFGKNLRERVLKIVLVGTIVILVSFSISAIKLLPGIEFMELSNRSLGVSYEEYLGHPIEWNNIVHIVVTMLFSARSISASAGIMGFLLLIFSLYNYKKRYIMFSLAVIVFSLFMATKGPIADLFFKMPIFGQLRHIERTVFLTAIASSILAGAGFSIFTERIKKLIKINKDMIIFSVVVVFILAELLFLQNFPQSVDIVNPTEIEINNYLSKDNDRFRTINLGLSTLVGASGYDFLSQLGIGTIKGGSGIWFNDYLIYLSIAQQNNPAKLWGLLNNKYVISDKELNLVDLKFIDEFKICKDCDIRRVSGPYLYENLNFLPRAYFVDKSILVVGNKQNIQQTIYSFILNNNFDPRKVVIIEGRESISKYSFEDFKKYDAVIISEYVSDNEILLLKNFIDNGGILLPDIFNNRNSINEKDIESLFDNLNGKFEEIEIVNYENNKVIYKVDNKKGFLILSERFSNFPGWQAIGKNKKEILKANSIITSVFVDNDDKIILKYRPKSLKNGVIITSIAMFLIIVYFIYLYRKNYGDKNKD